MSDKRFLNIKNETNKIELICPLCKVELVPVTFDPGIYRRPVDLLILRCPECDLHKVILESK